MVITYISDNESLIYLKEMKFRRRIDSLWLMVCRVWERVKLRMIFNFWILELFFDVFIGYVLFLGFIIFIRFFVRIF